MLSSEAPGVGTRNRRVDEGERFISLDDRRITAVQALRGLGASTTAAIAAVAFLSALLFVVYDAQTTMSQARIEPPSLRTIAAANTSGAAAFPGGQHTALAEMAGRGFAAFALAGLVTVLGARRRRQPENNGTERTQSYELLAASIPQGVACWTPQGRLILCNEQYRHQLGSMDMALGYEALLCALVAGGYMKLVQASEGHRLLELHRQDGSCLLVDERPMPDGGFMTLVSDITESKRTDDLLSTIREEQRLLARRYHEEKIKAEAASRAKTSFLAHLSHDIRTPLNHIIGFAELIRHETYGPLGDPRYGEYIQSIKASGEHLLASFATILDLAELEGGRKVLRNDPVPVDEVIATVSRRFRAQLKRAELKLDNGLPCGAVLRGDKLGYVRMVSNIVENAVRFTPRGGKITLAAFAAEDGVVIEISDTGIGMDEERLHSLSQPFALGDATFTREGGGPGLGLSISRAIAELSGGHMVIDSAPSMGTTVAISLPLETLAAQDAA